jgi:hypothetical protein
MRVYYVVFLAVIITFTSCTEDTSVTAKFSTKDLNDANRKLLEVAMEDAFPPPVASRVYVYPHIAHYLALQDFYPDSLPGLIGKLNGLMEFPELAKNDVNAELAALLAFCKVGKKVVFSEYYMEDLAEAFMEKAREKNFSNKTIEASLAYANQLSEFLIAWMNKDLYIETRTYDRFTSTKLAQNWRETPPDYIQALEPHWSKIRPLVIDSMSIYSPPPVPEYKTSKDSDFYKMVYQVYEESKNLDDEKIETAWFWDDNPNVSEHRGHMIVMIHKISPPGHWLNIIHQITEKEESSLLTATKAYTFTATAMFDAIISCWHVKFKTDLVRPITYIQEYIDPHWRPIIQTPPFPEYTSGHSAISASAAGILNTIFGKEYAFVDKTQLIFDMKERTFASFDDAAWEVSLSRFYGGIHYMIGIEEGNKQGYFIADYVLNKIKG